MHLQGSEYSPYDIGEQLLAEIAETNTNPFIVNNGRLVTQILFCLSLMIPFEETENKITRASDIICTAAFEAVKAQAVMSQTFRDKFGQLTA